MTSVGPAGSPPLYPPGDDRRLQALWQARDRFDLLSLDLFDTLILRRCGAADDLFLLVADRAIRRRLVIDGIDRWRFRALRLHAGKRAVSGLEGGEEEATLEAIYQQLPGRLGTPAELATIERELELEIGYLNPAVVALTRALLSEGKRLVILSDSWHPAEWLRHLLNHLGFDCQAAELILSSVDQGVTKRSGRLYHRLCQRLAPLPCERIHHLGDQAVADGASARAAGLHSTIYRADPEVERLLEWERMVHRDPLPHHRPLRRLATHLEPEGSLAWRLGTMVFGPALTIAAREAVAICRRRRVGVVWGLLREGGLLARLVAREAEWQGVPLAVELIALSRHTVSALHPPPTQREAVEEIARRPGCRVADFWSILGQPLPAEWLDDARVPVRELMGEAARFERLIGQSLEPERILCTIHHYQQRAAALCGYLQQRIERHPGSRIATLDLGWGATIQQAIEPHLARLGGSLPLHLLLLGDRRLLEAAVSGLEIHTLIGDTIDPRLAPLVQTLYRSNGVIEQLLSGSGSSVTGYTLEGGKWRPSGERASGVAADDPFRARLERAIECYQRLCHQSGMGATGDDREGALALLHRLIDLPTPQEARGIGALRLEGNHGTLGCQPVCSAASIGEAASIGVAQFLEEQSQRNGYAATPWPQGCATLADPSATLLRKLATSGDNGYLVTAWRLLEWLRGEGVERIWIHGAGEIGRAVSWVAPLTGVTIEGVIDSNPLLHGEQFNGVVVGPSDTLPAGDCQLLITSVAHADAIAGQLSAWLAGEQDPQRRITVWRFDRLPAMKFTTG